MSRNNIAFGKAKKPLKTKVTTDQIADKVEYLINEADPSIKTKRGTGDVIEIRLGRSKWLVKILKPRRKTAVII